MSGKHKIYYNNEWFEAEQFIDNFDNIYEIDYNGEILYNILLQKHSNVSVNNLICETLHPKNIIAKLYTSNLTDNYKNKLVVMMNDSILNDDYDGYNNILDIIEENGSIEEVIIEQNNSVERFDRETFEKLSNRYKKYPTLNVGLKCKNNTSIQNKLDKYIKAKNTTTNDIEIEIPKINASCNCTSNLYVQNKLAKYATANIRTQDNNNKIIQKKLLLNKITEEKEEKEEKEILRIEIRRELKKINSNNKLLKTYRVKHKKNQTYKQLHF